MGFIAESSQPVPCTELSVIHIGWTGRLNLFIWTGVRRKAISINVAVVSHFTHWTWLPVRNPSSIHIYMILFNFYRLFVAVHFYCNIHLDKGANIACSVSPGIREN